jgi:hypothetical protein
MTADEARKELQELRASWGYALAHGSGCAYGHHPDRKDIFAKEDELLQIIADEGKIRWQDADPKDVVEVRLPDEAYTAPPTNEMGEQCPWPWDPIQLKFAPIGQYRCPYCGAMVVAGIDHIDYSKIDQEVPT